jgi:hypothetical protein
LTSAAAGPPQGPAEESQSGDDISLIIIERRFQAMGEIQ